MNRARKRARRSARGRGAAARAAGALTDAVDAHRAGRLPEAEAGYRRVLAADPEHVEALHRLGVLSHQVGRMGEAASLIGRAAGQRPDDAALRHHQGNALRDAGRDAEAAEAYRAALRLAPDSPDAHCDLANLLGRSGQAAEAEAHYRQAIAAAPDHARSHNNLANLLRRQGRLEEAQAAAERAVALAPGYAVARANLGHVLLAQGRPQEAAAQLQEALRRQPKLAQAYNGLGMALAALGLLEEAVACYRRGLAVAPESADMHANLGWALATFDGRGEEAVAHFRAALARKPDLGHARDGLLRALRELRTPAHRPELESLLHEFFGAADVEPQPLAIPAADQLRHKHAAAARGDDWLEAEGAAADPLFAALAAHTVNADPALERAMTALRRRLLLSEVQDSAAARAAMSLLAQQAHNNGYVFSCEADERAAHAALGAEVEARLAAGADAEALEAELLAYAMYAPLDALAGGDALAQADPDAAPPRLRPVLARTLIEPREEAALARAIPSLGDAADATSRTVQAQYEESPYPRWHGIARPARQRFAERMRREFPHLELGGAFDGPLDILVAGCGTGQHPISRALALADARITAVDLSRASLGYAARMARRLAVDNVDFLQGDLRELAALEREFPVIECGGVLHHMADPAAGWTALTRILRPGGLMLVGLYSALGRRDVAAARERIAALGLAPVPDDIRAFRRRILDGEEPALTRLTRLLHFYDLNGCRDLLFHVQEHRFTIPDLARMLADQGLEFVGFRFRNPLVRPLYRREVPADPAMTDLDAWAEFEARHPDTFAGMYLFWCRKPG